MKRSKLNSKNLAKSYKSVMTLLLYFIGCYNTMVVVNAYPNQAGHCESGGDLDSKSLNAHGPGGGDDIEDLGLQITLTTSDSSSTITLDPSVTTFLESDTRYTITLSTKSSSSAAGFRGFLFRLKGRRGEDASNTLSVIPSKASISQELDFCGDFASGISHSEAKLLKNSIPIYLFFTKESGDLLLEVTVVQDNKPPPSNNWGYSTYKLKFFGKDFGTPSPRTNEPSNYPTISNFPSITPAPSLSISVTPGKFLYVWMLAASFCFLY